MTPIGPLMTAPCFYPGILNLPAPDVDRIQIERKGLVVTSDFTAWIGPWGISYSANPTPDETGTGNWTESQFLYAVKKQFQ